MGCKGDFFYNIGGVFYTNGYSSKQDFVPLASSQSPKIMVAWEPENAPDSVGVIRGWGS